MRHCKRRHAIRHEGEFVGVYPDFFYLRPGEQYLSAFYYEYFSGTDDEKLAGCLAAVPFDIKRREALIRVNAQAVRQVGDDMGMKLRVVHDASNKNTPSKAQVLGLPTEPNEKLGAELASTTVVDWYVYT